MRASFEQSGLRASNIGIFSKTEKDGSISYGECGSGVIFRKDGNIYYALTAAHVVRDETAQLLVFTTNTEMKSETPLPGIDYSVLTQETYDAMLYAETEYVSARDDLAVILPYKNTSYDTIFRCIIGGIILLIFVFEQ